MAARVSPSSTGAEPGSVDAGAGGGAPVQPGGGTALAVLAPSVPPGGAGNPRPGCKQHDPRYPTGVCHLRHVGYHDAGVGAHATGAAAWSPYFRALLAEAYGAAGQAEEGLRVLADAQALVTRTGEGFCEAELYRLAGVLHLTSPAATQAEAEGNITHALTIARRQGARSLELRAAI